MSQGNGGLLELAISPKARLALASLRECHGVSDADVADALVEWFAAQDPEVQQEIIESQAAIQQIAELPKLHPFRNHSDLRIRRSSASE
jgi:hypothetical protein